MSVMTQFDRELLELLTAPASKFAGLSLTHPRGARVLEIVTDYMSEGEGLLREAVATLQKESQEAYEAAEVVRQREAKAEDRFERLYNTLQGRRYTLSADNPEAGEAFASDLARATDGATPAQFRGLPLDRTEDVLRATIAFGGRVLAEDDPALQQASRALAQFSAARQVATREDAERGNSQLDLDAARDKARALYLGARRALHGALTVEGRAHTLSRYLAPLRVIYGKPVAPTPEPAPPNPSPTDTP